MALGKKVDALSADKTTATDSALTALASEISTLKTSTISLLEKAETDLTAEKEVSKAAIANTAKAQGDVAGIMAALKSACESMKLAIKENATAADMILAMSDGVSTTLAKLNIKAETIPTGKQITTVAPDANTKTRKDFEAMNPAARMDFMRQGGKVVE